MSGSITTTTNGIIVHSAETLETSNSAVNVDQTGLVLGFGDVGISFGADDITLLESDSPKIFAGVNSIYARHSSTVGWNLADDYVAFYKNRFTLNGLFLINDYTILSHDNTSQLIFETGRASLRLYNGSGPILDLNSTNNQTTLSNKLGEDELILGNYTTLKKYDSQYLLFAPDGTTTLTTSASLNFSADIINFSANSITGLVVQPSFTVIGSGTYNDINILEFGSNFSVANPSVKKAEISLNYTPDAFNAVVVAGQADIVASGETSLEVEAGAGMTITTDPVLRKLTISTSGTGSFITPSPFFTFTPNAPGSPTFYISGGGVYIPGKLTVDGAIDPTALILTPQASDPTSGDPTAIWVDTDNKVNVNKILAAQNGSAAEPTYGFGNFSNSGIYAGVDGGISVGSNGVEVVKLLSNLTGEGIFANGNIIFGITGSAADCAITPGEVKNYGIYFPGASGTAFAAAGSRVAGVTSTGLDIIGGSTANPSIYLYGSTTGLSLTSAQVNTSINAVKKLQVDSNGILINGQGTLDVPALRIADPTRGIYSTDTATNFVAGSTLILSLIDAGEVYVPGKLTVDGVIDPTALILTPVSLTDGGISDAQALWYETDNSRFIFNSKLLVSGGLQALGGILGTGLQLEAQASATDLTVWANSNKDNALYWTDDSEEDHKVIVSSGSAVIFGITLNIAHKTTDYMLLPTDDTITCSGAVQVTLNNIETYPIGKVFTVKHIGQGGSSTTLATLDSAMIDNANTKAINYPDPVRVQSDGTNWWII